jgi:hypothetical protein
LNRIWSYNYKYYQFWKYHLSGYKIHSIQFKCKWTVPEVNILFLTVRSNWHFVHKKSFLLF